MSIPLGILYMLTFEIVIVLFSGEIWKGAKRRKSAGTHACRTGDNFRQGGSSTFSKFDTTFLM